MTVSVPQAARELGLSVRTVRRAIANGAPVVRRGGRGRGRATLVDVDALKAWREGTADGRLLAVAADVPALVAGAMFDVFIQLEGPHKRAAAGALAGAGYLATVAVLDRLRADVHDVPEIYALPEKLDRLRLISGRSDIVDRPSKKRDTWDDRS